ncbi:MAG: glycosyltransferase, partial [Solirubrobacteraceae bacterium]
EPFGLAVLEALADGRPVIVEGEGGPAEVVDARCRVLYPPGDAVAAADALVGVIADPARATALGRAGRERARTRFELERAHTRFATLIHESARRSVSPAAPGFAIVTVSHNSATALEAMLGSVARHLPGVRTIVVDCASSDDSAAVARAHPLVTSISLAENVGLGAASNRGLEAVTEPVTVLLNPDVELLDDSLRALAREAQRGDERLLAPRVLSSDGHREDSVHPVPASPADLVGAVIPPALVSGTAAAPWGAGRPRRVGWAVGCAIAARTATLRALGPFDERIFLYGEDLDLGLRARARGIETWFWPAARVLHHRAHSTTVAFGGEPFQRLARARQAVVRRHLGAGRAALDDAAQAITFATRALAKPVLGRPAGRERRQLAALLRARRADGRP